MAFLELLPLPNKRHYLETLFLAVTCRALLFSDWKKGPKEIFGLFEQRMLDITGLSLTAVPVSAQKQAISFRAGIFMAYLYFVEHNKMTLYYMLYLILSPLLTCLSSCTPHDRECERWSVSLL